MSYVHRLPADISIPAVRQLLGAFTELIKVAVSLLVSDRRSEWNNSASTEWILYKSDIVYFSEIFPGNSILIKIGQE